MAFVPHCPVFIRQHAFATAQPASSSPLSQSTQLSGKSRRFRHPVYSFSTPRTRTTTSSSLEGSRSELPNPSSSSNTTPADGAAPNQSQDPFEAAQNALQETVDNIFNPIYTPLRAACPILSAPWQNIFGNYVLRPLAPSIPKAVLHFLGGAFFAAIPHQSYSTFLNRLCARGYVIVATPYSLSFDYLPVADSIVSAWGAIEADLATEYGPLPVIGVGHSAGAVFHTLTASLFSDAAPKAGNILISFNSRPASSAIPNYEDVVAPVARAFVNLENGLPNDVRQSINDLPQRVDSIIDKSSLTPSAVRKEVLPTARESRRFIEQVAPILRQIADYDESTDTSTNANNDSSASVGAERTVFATPFRSFEKKKTREFDPSPTEVRAVIEKLYAVSETLVVRFDNDSLDDSDDLIDALRINANGSNFSVVQLSGTHVTPLTQDGPNMGAATAAAAKADGGSMPQVLSSFIGTLGTMVGSIGAEVLGAVGIRDLINLENVIDNWVDAAIANGKI